MRGESACLWIGDQPQFLSDDGSVDPCPDPQAYAGGIELLLDMRRGHAKRGGDLIKSLTG